MLPEISCLVGFFVVVVYCKKKEKRVENQPEGRDCHSYCFHKILQMCMVCCVVVFFSFFFSLFFSFSSPSHISALSRGDQFTL